jgi:hypothetical protein
VKMLKKPVFVELSAEIPRPVETKAMMRAVAYISRHNIEAILLLVHDSERARDIARTAVNDINYRDWLEKFGFENMNKIIDKWESIYS